MTTDASKLEFVDTVVDLTHHQTPQAITDALLQALKKLIPATKFSLFSISNSNRDSEFNEQNAKDAFVLDLFDQTAGQSLPLADDEDLMNCVQARSRIKSDTAGKPRLILPVFGALDIWALLTIEGVTDVSAQYEKLARLLRVYSNQMHMLARSEIDPLTGLHNRQSFYERLAQIAARGNRRRRATDASAEVSTHAFALVDIDHFKEINDQYGHPYGDEFLVVLARLISRSFRYDDMLFRYGGEEFAIVLANVAQDAAFSVLDRFRAKTQAHEFPGMGHRTLSIGFTMIDTGVPNIDIQKIIKCADKALYYAKNHGRNRVACYEKLVETGELAQVASSQTDIELF